jgi:hypothetical protein
MNITFMAFFHARNLITPAYFCQKNKHPCHCPCTDISQVSAIIMAGTVSAYTGATKSQAVSEDSRDEKD